MNDTKAEAPERGLKPSGEPHKKDLPPAAAWLRSRPTNNQ